MGRLAGKRAVVIGASGKDNIGQVIARRFAQEGATVLVSGRRREPLERLAGEIGGHAAGCDITRREEVFALADAAVAAMGGVDIAVQSTGWGLLKPFLENTEAELRAMSDLQFLGPIYFFQAMIGVMSTGGSLITLSSVTADIVINDHAAYQGAKAGIDHVIRCVAAEFGPRGIRANSLSPGLTATPMTAGMEPVFERVVSTIPLRRLNTTDDVAAAAVWLASDECFMTGENLQINGGYRLTGGAVQPR